MAYDPNVWKDFYIMCGGAAAALTGLLFVGLSNRAKVIKGTPFWNSRADGTLMLLTTQLLIAALVLMPGQPLHILGIEVEIAALFFLFLTLRAWWIARTSRGLPKMSVPRRAAEIAGEAVWNLVFLGSGFSLIYQRGGGFYWLAFVMMGGFAWNVYVEWMVITEIQSDGDGHDGTS